MIYKITIKFKPKERCGDLRKYTNMEDIKIAIATINRIMNIIQKYTIRLYEYGDIALELTTRYSGHIEELCLAMEMLLSGLKYELGREYSSIRITKFD
jgi:hypothetical protein